MRINYRTVGRVAVGAARGGYAAYRAGPGYQTFGPYARYGATAADVAAGAQVATDTLNAILRAAGSGKGNTWDAVVGGLTETFLRQYDTVTIASNATPPVTVNLKDALASGPPSPAARWLQPTVILTGPAGRQVIAPYGVSSGSHGGPLLIVLGLFGLGFVFGRLT